MKWIVLALVYFNIYSIKSQNLVPNPSFEEYSQCPNKLGQLDYVDSWFEVVNSSVDFYHICSKNSDVSIPKNIIGYQFPRTDSAYISIGVYASTIANAREYVGVQLITSLEAGKVYKLTLYLSLVNSSRFAISNFGVYFSKEKLMSYCNINNSVMDCVFPQIENSKNNYLDDTLNWNEYTGYYVAKGGEKYITLGNFDLDAETNFYVFNSNAPYPHAGYFIDDVSVIKLPDHDINMGTITHTSNCYSDSSSISLCFQNTGTKALDYTVDTVTFSTEVKVNGIVVQNFDFELNSNINNPVPNAPLAPDSFMSIEIFPVDLGRLGELHEISLVSSFARDEDNSNDTASMEITPMLDVGEMSVFPLKVCSGEEVDLQTQNYIGEPVWQYSTDGKNWHNLAAGASASHRPNYSTFYRLEICGFLHSDSVLVEVPLVRPPQNYYDTACENTSLKIELVIDAAVQELRWFDQIDDLIHTGFSNEVFLNGSKTFYVQAKEQDCWSEERAVVSIHAEECPLVIPNIFTPNGDGTNDLFIIGSSEGKELKTTIYNRWGEEVANFRGNEGWDGAGLPDGVYFYIVREMSHGTIHKIHKGEVMIVR